MNRMDFDKELWTMASEFPSDTVIHELNYPWQGSAGRGRFIIIVHGSFSGIKNLCSMSECLWLYFLLIAVSQNNIGTGASVGGLFVNY